MSLEFPASPTVGDTYTVGARTWSWSGTIWEITGTVAAAGSIGTTELADSAITTAKIAAGAVAEADIADGAVTTAKIAAGAVVEADIASNAVTQAKLSSTLSGVTICTSSTRPGSPFTGQYIYMTDVSQEAVWSGTTWVGTAPIAGGRNSIINGGMDVFQRSSISAAGYGLDRWYFSTYGTSWNSLSVTQQTSGAPTNFRYYMRVAAGSTTSTNISFGQSLETNAVIKLAGKVVNLSFYYRVNTNFSTAFTVTPVSTTGTDANISTVPNGTAIGSSQTITNTTSWTRFSYSFTVPSNATSFAIQFWNNGNTVSTASLDITGVQLEAGAVATPFEFEDYGTTLQKCQRYYYQQVSGTGKVFAQGFFYNSAQWEAAVFFPVTMRTAPTLVVSSGSNYYNTRETSARQVSGITIARGHENGALLYGTVSGGVASAGAGIETVNAAGSVAYNAEL
jgi:hypothetical protein